MKSLYLFLVGVFDGGCLGDGFTVGNLRLTHIALNLYYIHIYESGNNSKVITWTYLELSLHAVDDDLQVQFSLNDVFINLV